MNISKTLKRLKTSHYVFFFLVLALGFVLLNYESAKSLFSEKYDGQLKLSPSSVTDENEVSEYDKNGGFAPVQDTSGEQNAPEINPVELLPKDDNNAWGNLNPNAPNSIETNLLKPMVGQVMRNANLQLRADPVNPQSSVGPWNNSTITPDETRRNFELN